MSSIDPLQLLRDYVMQNKEIKLKDNMLVFGSKQLPIDTPTAWQPRNTQKAYKLGDLWLFLSHKIKPDAKPSDYFQEYSTLSKKHSLQMISMPHQDQIVKYFTGQIDTSEDINETARTSFRQGQHLGKRKPQQGLTDEQAALAPGQAGVSLKHVKTDSGYDQLVKNLLGDSIDFESRTEERPKLIEMLDQLRRQERVHDSKNGRLRRAKSFKFCIDLLVTAATSNATTKERTHQTVLQEIQSQSNLEEAKPIIVVPSTCSAGNLNLKNAKQFFVDGKYVEIKDQRLHDTASIEFKHNVNDQDVTFEVTDDIAALNTNNKINRVVAIFLTNNPYQFKSAEKQYGEGNIAKLLHKFRGYMMRYSDVPLDANIKAWNTKSLLINRTQRHKDILIRREFWEDMIKFLNTPR